MECTKNYKNNDKKQWQKTAEIQKDTNARKIMLEKSVGGV